VELKNPPESFLISGNRVPAVPTVLRPTAPIAAAAILVGDPGRALLLATELLEEPMMSNHAHGLWGYSGRTPGGPELTIQATGIGGPSAALVLTDLAELGVRHAVRVGTCLAADPGSSPGQLLLVEKAIAEGGSAASFGLSRGEAVFPDPQLTGRLRDQLGGRARQIVVESFDAAPEARQPDDGEGAADMQTVAILARAKSLGVAAAAVLIATETRGGDVLAADDREEAERRAGRAASRAILDL
jgi:uridine phosphorylase